MDVLDKEVLKDDHVGRCVMELSGARGLITLGTPCEHPGCLGGGVRACARVVAPPHLALKMGSSLRLSTTLGGDPRKRQPSLC